MTSTIVHRLSSHRLIDADGRFYCASDISDCKRLLKSSLGGAGRVEENRDPVWVNDRDSGWYTGPDTIQYLNGHPITDAEMAAYEADRDIRSGRITEAGGVEAGQDDADIHGPSRQSSVQSVSISCGAYQGMTEAKAGMRVSVPVAGDRQGRKCFATRQTGTIERVQLRRTPMPTLYVRLDELAKFAGTHVTVYPNDAIALDAEADDIKRGRGRPSKPKSEHVVQLASRVQPSTFDAYKADGRTLDEIVRAGLGLA